MDDEMIEGDRQDFKDVGIAIIAILLGVILLPPIWYCMHQWWIYWLPFLWGGR